MRLSIWKRIWSRWVRQAPWKRCASCNSHTRGFQRRDGLSPSIEFHLDESHRSAYDTLIGVIDALHQNEALWHIPRCTESCYPRWNGDTPHLQHPVLVSVSKLAPAGVRLNITPRAIIAGRMCLCFLPDSVLFFRDHRPLTVPYSQLVVGVSLIPVVELGPDPSSARQIGETWLHANMDGGPDRRFRHNVKVPVVQYAQIYLTSKSGLNETLRCSCPVTANRFWIAMRTASRISREGSRLSNSTSLSQA
jgi:hypothetical protein